MWGEKAQLGVAQAPPLLGTRTARRSCEVLRLSNFEKRGMGQMCSLWKKEKEKRQIISKNGVAPRQRTKLITRTNGGPQGKGEHEQPVTYEGIAINHVVE